MRRFAGLRCARPIGSVCSRALSPVVRLPACAVRASSGASAAAISRRAFACRPALCAPHQARLQPLSLDGCPLCRPALCAPHQARLRPLSLDGCPLCRTALCAPHQARLQPRSFAGRLLADLRCARLPHVRLQPLSLDGYPLAGLRCARLSRGRRGACPRMGGFENETGLPPARVRPGTPAGERGGSAPFRASRAGAARE